jgi:hypothetical protein
LSSVVTPQTRPCHDLLRFGHSTDSDTERRKKASS